MLMETWEHLRLRQVSASPESHGQVAAVLGQGSVTWFGEWLAQNLGL